MVSLMRVGAAPNQRIKLARRGGHSWWNWLVLIVAAPPRSLCAIR